MKLFICSIWIFLSLSSFASIIDSTYSPRHQKLIKKAVHHNCGPMRSLTEISKEVVKKQIDQGQVDYTYYTTFRGIKRIDQGLVDEYQIEVVSERGDFYDHEARDHGYYEVLSVKCTLL